MSVNLGIRTKKPERTPEELHKVTEMVKNKNYNHPEIGIIKESDFQRMKVSISLFRKLSANLPRRNLSRRGDLLKKKKSTNWLLPRLRGRKCSGSRRKRKRNCHWTSSKKNDFRKVEPSTKGQSKSPSRSLMMSRK